MRSTDGSGLLPIRSERRTEARARARGRGSAAWPGATGAGVRVSRERSSSYSGQERGNCCGEKRPWRRPTPVTAVLRPRGCVRSWKEGRGERSSPGRHRRARRTRGRVGHGESVRGGRRCRGRRREMAALKHIRGSRPTAWRRVGDRQYSKGWREARRERTSIIFFVNA